jgi:hypothetical protein
MSRKAVLIPLLVLAALAAFNVSCDSGGSQPDSGKPKDSGSDFCANDLDCDPPFKCIEHQCIDIGEDAGEDDSGTVTDGGGSKDGGGAKDGGGDSDGGADAGKDGGSPMKCDSTNCSTGCCVGATCFGGSGDTACGEGGNSCTDCTKTSQSCIGHQCGTCNNGSCPNGCCANGACQIGNLNAQCGTGGISCQDCSKNATNKYCDATLKQCVACGLSTCPSGCCSSNVCHIGNADDKCGYGGAACSKCNPPQYCISQECK